MLEAYNSSTHIMNIHYKSFIRPNKVTLKYSIYVHLTICCGDAHNYMMLKNSVFTSSHRDVTGLNLIVLR